MLISTLMGDQCHSHRLKQQTSSVVNYLLPHANTAYISLSPITGNETRSAPQTTSGGLISPPPRSPPLSFLHFLSPKSAHARTPPAASFAASPSVNALSGDASPAVISYRQSANGATKRISALHCGTGPIRLQLPFQPSLRADPP